MGGKWITFDLRPVVLLILTTGCIRVTKPQPQPTTPDMPDPYEVPG